MTEITNDVLALIFFNEHLVKVFCIINHMGKLE
jgi:hypothetical protein